MCHAGIVNVTQDLPSFKFRLKYGLGAKSQIVLNSQDNLSVGLEKNKYLKTVSTWPVYVHV